MHSQASLVHRLSHTVFFCNWKLFLQLQKKKAVLEGKVVVLQFVGSNRNTIQVVVLLVAPCRAHAVIIYLVYGCALCPCTAVSLTHSQGS